MADKDKKPIIIKEEKPFNERYPVAHFFLQLFGIGGSLLAFLAIVFLLMLQALGIIKILI